MRRNRASPATYTPLSGTSRSASSTTRKSAAARAEAEQAARKLDNAEFTAKAPSAIVAKTRERLEAARSDITRLEQRLAAI